MGGHTRVPAVVVVGSAARDIDEADPRGWRLGGGVTYGALACARLGLRTAALVGLDPLAQDARELGMLEDAGVQLVRVPLPSGPVFHNVETLHGRVQTYLSAATPVPIEALPDPWRDAAAWLLAPVAGEVTDGWAAVPDPAACVALGWQGILRRLVVGERVTPLVPTASPLLARVDLCGISRHDIPHELTLSTLVGFLRPGARLLLTAGERGGAIVHLDPAGRIRGRAYPAIPARGDIDPTGAGDATLASLLAGRMLIGDAVGWEARAAHLAALAGSLLVERVGLDAVPTRQQIRERRT
jgi:sugar/nucleoside kinase (ribokinase family)